MLDWAHRAVVLYAVLRFVFRAHQAEEGSRVGMGVAGGMLVSLALARVAFFVGMGLWHPRATIVPDDDRYHPMRPSRIAFSLHQTCRPSGWSP